MPRAYEGLLHKEGRMDPGGPPAHVVTYKTVNVRVRGIIKLGLLGSSSKTTAVDCSALEVHIIDRRKE